MKSRATDTGGWITRTRVSPIAGSISRRFGRLAPCEQRLRRPAAMPGRHVVGSTSMMARMDGGTAQAEALKDVTEEDAAHQKRNWVRLTFDCNDRCVFCLDAHTHDGTIRSREEVKAQILDGRRKGADRLILSGGEPTIHPDYV